MTLTITAAAKTKFLDVISKAGLDEQNVDVGILVRPHTQRTIDYGLTCAASGFTSQTINGVLFYFHPDLPSETWEADWNGTGFVSTEQ